ncbi:MAG: PAS domain-containing protein, partial [Myxococcota bacterium]
MAYPTPSHGFRAQTLRALLAVERPLQEALRDALETSHAPRFVTTPCDDLHAVQSLTPLSRFDLLFFEWREPDDLGIAADLRKEAPHIAMVAVSGTVDANSARRLSSIGGQDILDKNALHQELVIRVARDSVERQRLVEEARRRHDLAQSAEHELQRFIDNSVDAMAVIDATGRVLHWNPAGAALTGRSIDDLVDH